MRKILTLVCLLTSLISSPVWAKSDQHISVQSLEGPAGHGEIQGRVQNCTRQETLEDILLHVPGKSIATRLGKDGSFHLHFVPTGSFNLNLEMDDRTVGEVKNIPVKEGSVTHLNSIQICVTEKDKREISAGNSPTPKASKIRCPKGGFTCSSSWHNIKARKSSENRANEAQAETSKAPSIYIVGEGLKLIRVQ